MGLKKQEYVSVIIAIGIIVTILVLLLASIVKFSDVSTAIAGVLVAGISGVLVWGFRSRLITSTSKDNISNNTIHKITKDDEPKKNKVPENKDKIKNTIKIRVDDYKVYEFDLKRGERITGAISADGTFNMYFLTKSSLRSFENDYACNPIDGIDDAHYFEPQFEAPRRDIFYTVIENADNKNIIVDVELYV